MPEQKREEFRILLSDAARPFLLGYTQRFFDELELFLASGLNVEAYDKVCKQRLGMMSGGTREHNEEFCDEALQNRYLHFLDEDGERTD
ncbi:putative E3 ubiquitin-protein ligase Topors [Cocos nucifera]|uniref:Putative E3 ubiquitin-protein ligase Topors n=1 Tax=Cocos nucifera TaxID=13894 RepID=A0A8K0N0P3_COCNU|nr:putative E3 ubiquitin-protein ligase Topors [Cocos nucifera]